MNFDGQVGDMGSGSVKGGVTYELLWSGTDLEKLRKYVGDRLNGKEVVERIERREGEKWVCGGRVRSEAGVI